MVNPEANFIANRCETHVASQRKNVRPPKAERAREGLAGPRRRDGRVGVEERGVRARLRRLRGLG